MIEIEPDSIHAWTIRTQTDMKDDRRHNEQPSARGAKHLSRDTGDCLCCADTASARRAAWIRVLQLTGSAEAEGGANPVAVLRAAARRLAQHFGGACLIWLRRQRNQLVPVALEHTDPEARALLRWLWQRNNAATTDAFGTEILQTGLPIVMPAVSSATLALWTHPAFTPYFARHEVISLLVVPLLCGDRVAGTIAVWREMPRAAFERLDVGFLEDTAQLLASAVTVRTPLTEPCAPGERRGLGQPPARIISLSRRPHRGAEDGA